jgi:signal transduction histidine kinase
MSAIIAERRHRPIQASDLRRINIIRYVLPLTLFLLATAFEFWDHWPNDESPSVDWLGMSEIAIFGFLGPVAVYMVLTYVVALLKEIAHVHTRITALNYGLEQLVAQRTAALQASNEDLAQANDRLRNMDQIKSDFVALVSHELRAPLATLNGGLEVALQHADDLPIRTRRVLNLMSGETQRLTQFVQTILDVSQLEAGKLQLTCGPLAVKPLMRRAVEIVFGNDDPRIVWKLPSNLPPVWADEIYAEEAILNLLRNAQKYTPPHSLIELTATISERRVRLCVTDHGPGISAEAQILLFERFYRADQSSERTQRGWGLGLYCARILISAQHGSLMLESPAHANSAAPGSRFVVELLIAEEMQDYGKSATD